MKTKAAFSALKKGGRRTAHLLMAGSILTHSFFTTPILAQDEEKARREEALPLPAWPAADRNTLQAERSLWPEDFDPNEVVHPANVVSPATKPGDDEGWSHFLPRGLFSGSAKKEAAASAAAPLKDMPLDAWRACEEMPTETRLFDPQGLLSETQAEDLRRLLSFHSGRAGVAAAMVLLDARQKLPLGAELSRLAGGALARVPACIVVYPLGEPDRTRVFFTQAVARVAEPSYLENLASTCIREASSNPDPVEQVQRFGIQLSIRLFWLERAYPALQPAPVTPPALPVPETVTEAPSVPSKPVIKLAKAPAVVPITTAQEQPPLSEVTPFQSAPSLASRAGAFLTQNKIGLFILVGIVVLAGLLAVGILMLLRWRRRQLRQSVWLLPDRNTPSPNRLGGTHCGASGAYIQYG